MISIPTDNGIVQLPKSAVLAVVQRADRAAELTADVLDAMGFRGDGVSKGQNDFPPAYLLELAAVLQLGALEQAGICCHIECGLPSFGEAAAELCRRVEHDPSSFERLEAATLHRRVLPFLMDQLAWQRPADWGAEVVFDCSGEEELIDAVAEFLWTHRHVLGGLLPEGDS